MLRARAVDAIDIEQSAIDFATKHNAGPNIQYLRSDAVTEPFRRASYDVIVFDGAIGHFPIDGIKVLLQKIGAALSADGVFCGSESLGHEGHDHLCFFETLDDLRALLSIYFADVAVKEQTYRIQGGVRREAFWRCANRPGRLKELDWR